METKEKKTRTYGLSGRPKDEARCSEEVWDKFHSYQCARKAVVAEEGEGWCKQHAPSAKAKRRAKSEAAWKARSEAFRAKLDKEQSDAAKLALFDEAMALLERVAFEPIGHPEASDKEILDVITQEARALLAKLKP